MPPWFQIALVLIVLIALIMLLVFAATRGNLSWAGLLDVLERFIPCCSGLGVLLLTCVTMIGGLVLWHSMLLVVGAGTSLLTLLLLGWASTRRKQFLAARK
jgi:hypothetical protein